MKSIIKNENDYDLIDLVGGVLAEPLGDYTSYRFRDLMKYCKENNTLPKYLSEEKLKEFELRN